MKADELSGYIGEIDDELIIKECCKKHLSSDTYVKNHLENKKLYDRITDILVNSLN